MTRQVHEKYKFCCIHSLKPSNSFSLYTHSQQQVVHFFLCLSLASLTPTRATYKDCYKTKYITATHESFVNLNIHEDPDCKQCPDGSVEIARVDLIPGNYYKDVMIYWNKENIFIKVCYNSPANKPFKCFTDNMNWCANNYNLS